MFEITQIKFIKAKRFGAPSAETSFLSVFFFHKVFLFMMLHIFKVRNRNFATELEVISTFGPQGKDNSLNDHITPEIRNFLIQI